MKAIISKRHAFNFYGVLIFVSLFFGGIGSFILFEIVDLSESNAKDLIAIGVFVYLFVFLFIYSFVRNTPAIIVNEHSIKFGKKSFRLKDINEVKLTGKRYFRYIFFAYMEATTLVFKDGTEKVIFDSVYSNSHKIKSFLKQVVIDKKEYKPYQISKVDKNTIKSEPIKLFKGNPVLSFRGIMLWGVILFFSYLFFFKPLPKSNIPYIFLGVYGLFWFILSSWMMYFFGLTRNYLIVKNHYFLWKFKAYKLTDIHKVIYESQGRNPNCMRIITKDFKYKLYRAGTLRDKTWIKLMHQLREKGVDVRNECIPE